MIILAAFLMGVGVALLVVGLIGMRAWRYLKRVDSELVDCRRMITEGLGKDIIV